MGFFHAGQFLYVYKRYRLGAMAGRLGSGKTSLALKLAHHFLEAGLVDGIWANFPHTLPVRYKLKRTFFILDEAAEHADARKSATDYSGYGVYVRKLKSFLFAASMNEVDKRVKQIRVQQVMTFTLFGRKIWIYQYQIYDSKEKDWFGWLDPDEMWGTYDTEYVPNDDGGIALAFQAIRPKEMPKLNDEQFRKLRELIYENENSTFEEISDYYRNIGFGLEAFSDVE